MARCHCDGTERMFDPRIARRELRRFRRRGAPASTLSLLAGIGGAGLPQGVTLLDVGGGVGAIHHALLGQGFSRATQVDASSAYLAAAEDESKRLGHGDRVTFLHGDFAALEAELPEFDVVTLDRVVCCDPDYETILGSAATHARRLVAITFPRANWGTRAFVGAGNAFRRITGESFRAYIHDPAAMAGVLERNGFVRRAAGGTFIWATEVFDREGTAPVPPLSRPPTRTA